MNLKKAAIVLGVILVISFIASIVWFIVMQQTTGRVVIDSVPNDARVLVNGNLVSPGSEIRLGAGKHTVKATRDNFTDLETTFDLTVGELKTVEAYMVPANDEGRAWLQMNPDQAQKIEGASSREFVRQSRARTDNNPLIKYMPVLDPTFRIDYGASKENPDEVEATALYIKASTQQGRDNALDWIKYKGFNPDDLEIIFVTP